MNKIILIGFLMVFLMSMVMAENGIEIKINNNMVSVRGYTTDPIYGKVDFGIFQKINESMGTFFTCNNFTIGNQTYQDNCTLNINYHKDIPLYSHNQSSSTIIGNNELYQQLLNCQELKQQYNAGLDSCVKDKGTLVDFGNNYSQCSTDKQICLSDKSNLETKISGLEEDIDEHKNSNWWYGLIGLVIGGVVIAYKTNLIGGPRTKRTDETFNPTQSA